MITLNQANPKAPCCVAFAGLAPFLRMSIAGIDLRPLGQAMLAQAQIHDDEALWMALATIMMAIGHRDSGLAIQSQALASRCVYPIPAKQQPAKFRLLLLMVAGDLAANTPLECLLENSDIDLIFYYITPNNLLEEAIPEHDLMMIAMSADDENLALLRELESVVPEWPRPVINLPQFIPATIRDVASELLQNVPGLLMPPTLRATRAELQAIANAEVTIPALFADCDFPVILRPIGSQAGRDLDRLTNPVEMAAYLDRVAGDGFYISRFIDYSGRDGLFRKCRVALINGEPFACHMAVSKNWMIHYVNAGMYEDAAKRAEEGEFMANFADFASRHRTALNAIHQQTQLDYVCIDCAETQDGQLLVFEVDHVMVVHAMDEAHLFPYKQVYMAKVRNAFRNYLISLLQNTDSNQGMAHETR